MAAPAPASRRFSARWVALLGLVALVLAVWVGWRLLDPPVTAKPALWRISKGDRHAWLFGTIHAVPAGSRWMGPEIEKAARESEWLVLEATGLEDERANRRIFEKLGRSPGLPPVAARLGPAGRTQLKVLTETLPGGMADPDGYESWAAALLISAAANQGVSQAEAGEARFEALFRKDRRRILGLETIEAQLGTFDALPEKDQRALLSQAIADSRDAEAQFRRLYGFWASGDLNRLEAQFLNPLKGFPALKGAIIDRRNALWAQQIDRLLRQNDRVLFIAVGAGHLIGIESVQARLRTQGWRIDRVQ